VNGVRYHQRVQIGERAFDCLASIPLSTSCSMVVELLPTMSETLPEAEVAATLQQLQTDLAASSQWRTGHTRWHAAREPRSHRILSPACVCASLLDNIYHGSQLVLTRLNGVLKYDRAVVYQLALPDAHAKCVAEERRLTSLFPFLGLKFPPLEETERAKYAQVGVRVVVDTTSFPSTLIGSFDPTFKPVSMRSPRGSLTTVFPSTPLAPRSASAAAAPAAAAAAAEPSACRFAECEQHLNLSHAFLRLPMASYLDLLRSLSIASSLSVSVTVARQPPAESPQLHSVMEFYSLAQKPTLGWNQLQLVRAAECIFARWIEQQERNTLVLQRKQLHQLSERVRSLMEHRLQISPSTSLQLLLCGNPDLCELAGSDNFAFVCEKEWLRVGALPPQTWLDRFVRWFADEAEDQRANTHLDGWRADKVWSTIKSVAQSAQRASIDCALSI
jgi:hypothetical protein